MPDTPAVTSPDAVLARWFGAIVLCLSVFIPSFSYGIWFQSEPVTVGLLCMGALAAACLVSLEPTGHDVARVFKSSPIRILTAFVAWNAVTSMFHAFPGRSWFGSPEIGEGIFAFLALLCLAWLSLALWPFKSQRLTIAVASLCGGLTITALNAWYPQGSPWRPQLYAAYAVSVAFPVALIVAGCTPCPGRKGLLAGCLAAIALAEFSANKTAIALALICPLIYAAIGWLSGRHAFFRRVD
jgi:hypothetical protein